MTYEVFSFEPIAIPMEDAPLHTDAHPVCSDVTCPCHDEQEQQVTVRFWPINVERYGSTFMRTFPNKAAWERVHAHLRGDYHKIEVVEQEPTECEQEAWTDVYGDGDGC